MIGMGAVNFHKLSAEEEKSGRKQLSIIPVPVFSHSLKRAFFLSSFVHGSGRAFEGTDRHHHRRLWRDRRRDRHPTCHPRRQRCHHILQQLFQGRSPRLQDQHLLVFFPCDLRESGRLQGRASEKTLRRF